MRVAANEVERVLTLARDEVRQSDSPEQTRTDSLAALVAAFRRAAELRDTPTYGAYVRGRKDLIRRMVLVMTLTRIGADGTEYVACVQPYNDVEMTGRKHDKITTRRVSKAGRDHAGLDYEYEMFLPAAAHIKWIRRNRLEAA